MNISELKGVLQDFYDNQNQMSVCVYAIVKGRECDTPTKLDVEDKSIEDLKTVLFMALKQAVNDNDQLSILNLSTSDDRNNAIYAYDLQIPDELKVMEVIIKLDNLLPMDINKFDLTTITALLFEVGNNEKQIVLYKNMTPVEIFGRGRYIFGKSNSRLKKIEGDFLRISPRIDMLKVDDQLLIFNLKILERNFGFHDIVKREAIKGIAAIEAMNIVSDIHALRELTEDIAYARRFTKVARSSPVIAKSIPNATIIQFCQEYPSLKNRIKFNDAGDQIILSTKAAKTQFIKLLMDDLLTSQLTELHYESRAKDKADEDLDDKL